MMTSAKGGCALITGGGSGIGRAVCLELARGGRDIAFVDVSADMAQETIRMVEDEGTRAVFMEADVSDFAEAQRVVSGAVEELGGLEILVNNAGINRDGVIWKMSEEQWDTVINTNLKGYFNYIRAVSPLFREQRFGKIVNISSINGMRGKFGQANYAASKAAIIGLTKSVAVELGKYGVNVNAVAPGLVITPMTRNLPENIIKQAMDETVLKRLAEPGDVAAVVAFLCSEKAKHITGEVIKVDGGQYI